MLRAAWKSLLGRKLRLLMSTFAIVLGVAFVAGTLVFTDTLSRSFTAIFASSVGDVVVTPKGAHTADGAPTTRTVPASLVHTLAGAEGAARADGNVSSTGVFVVDQHGKLVGGNGPHTLRRVIDYGDEGAKDYLRVDGNDVIVVTTSDPQVAQDTASAIK